MLERGKVVRQNEREILADETLQTYFVRRYFRFVSRAKMELRQSARYVALIVQSLIDFFYMTYQGFGIILWLTVFAMLPLVALTLFVFAPLPIKIALAFAGIFGFSCVTRSRWKGH